MKKLFEALLESLLILGIALLALVIMYVIGAIVSTVRGNAWTYLI
jgi:hypothetical protein